MRHSVRHERSNISDLNIGALRSMPRGTLDPEETWVTMVMTHLQLQMAPEAGLAIAAVGSGCNRASGTVPAGMLAMASGVAARDRLQGGGTWAATSSAPHPVFNDRSRQLSGEPPSAPLTPSRRAIPDVGPLQWPGTSTVILLAHRSMEPGTGRLRPLLSISSFKLTLS